MVELRINEQDLRRIKRLMRKLEPRRRASVWFLGMDKVAGVILSKLKENVTNRILRVRTGRLRASLNRVVRFTADGIEAVVGSGVGFGKRVKYANILETGGIIRPRRAKYLTIPLSSALTKAGATKYPSARDYPNTFVRNGVIYQKVGKRKVVPIFVLKKEVRIPAKRYLSRTVEMVRGRVGRLLVDTIEREIRRV